MSRNRKKLIVVKRNNSSFKNFDDASREISKFHYHTLIFTPSPTTHPYLFHPTKISLAQSWIFNRTLVVLVEEEKAEERKTGKRRNNLLQDYGWTAAIFQILEIPPASWNEDTSKTPSPILIRGPRTSEHPSAFEASDFLVIDATPPFVFLAATPFPPVLLSRAKGGHAALPSPPFVRFEWRRIVRLPPSSTYTQNGAAKTRSRAEGVATVNAWNYRAISTGGWWYIRVGEEVDSVRPSFFAISSSSNSVRSTRIVDRRHSFRSSLEVDLIDGCSSLLFTILFSIFRSTFCEWISRLAVSFVLSDLGLNLSLILAGGVMVESLNRVGILFIDRGEIFLSFSIIEL